MKKEYLEIKNKYTELKECLRKQLINISEKEDEELSKLIDFKDKFVEITTNMHVMYLYVDEQFYHSMGITGHSCVVLRGQGFYSEFTDYRDATYAKWDQFCEYDINIDNFDKELENIKEITKEEYDKAFDDMIQQMITEHKERYF